MADDLAQLTAKKIANTNFLSVLRDGTLDITVKEKESLFVMFLNKQAEGKMFMSKQHSLAYRPWNMLMRKECLTQ